MIDEKKLIEEIEKEIDGVIVKDTYSKGKNAGLRKAKILAEEQPKTGGWIPCSERLPEESGFYMVTKKIKETGNRFTGKSRFDIEKGWNDSLDFVDIVAWQPLPEAYHG